MWALIRSFLTFTGHLISKRLRSILIPWFILAGSSCVLAEQPPFRFEDFESEAEAKRVIESTVPSNASVNDIRTIMQLAGAKCFDIEGNEFICRRDPDVARLALIKVGWIIVFDLNPEQRLNTVKVTRYLRGP